MPLICMTDVEKVPRAACDLEFEVVTTEFWSAEEIAALKDFAISRKNQFDPEDCYFIPTKPVPSNVEVLFNLGTTQLTDPHEFYRQWLDKTIGEAFPHLIDNIFANFIAENDIALEPASNYGIVITDEDPNDVDDLSLLRVVAIPEEFEKILVRYVNLKKQL